jgi:peptidoglycan/LPS O-acetylase OafA/YrhL
MGVASSSAALPRRGRIPFRGDIEGLRGLATLLVLAYHADVPFTDGGYVGLDVFFVMSGFLITALLIREAEDSGSISLRQFFARRIRRLLPSVVAVLAFIVAAGWLIMSPLQRESLAGDVLAANFYVVNWRFVQQQTDYLGAGLAASPVQHFWSLSVEEQFYVVWPVMVLAAVTLAYRFGRSIRLSTGVAAAIVGIGLFAYSLDHTREAAGAAYFSTLSRGWEFALGAAIALIPASRVRMPRAASTALVIGSLAVLAWCTITFDETTSFPGPAALVPCLATAAIIVAGMAHTDTRTARLLNLRPSRWVGRISYSWYLWHWPLLVFAAVLWGDISVPVKVAVVAIALVPTLIAHRYVEEPFRHARVFARSPAGAFRLGAVCTGIVAVFGITSWMAIPTAPIASASEAVGARALQTEGTRIQQSARAIRPEPRSAIRDRGRADTDGCLVRPRDLRSGPCVYGAPGPAPGGGRRPTMILFGDSHAMQWFPALEVIATRRGWRLVVLTKAGCTPADVQMYNGQLRRHYRECETWRRHTLRRIARERPSLIVIGNASSHQVMRSGSRLDGRASEAALEAGLIRTLRTLRARTRAQVRVIRENPRPDIDVRACVSESLRNLGRCSFRRAQAWGHRPVNRNAAARVAGVALLDPLPMLCPGSRCPAVVGNVLIYRNTAHITATYVLTLTPYLAARLPVRLPVR